MANPSKIQAEVVSVEAFGSEVFEIKMKPLSRVPRFKAGQFLHLTINEYDPLGGFWPESRVFSIASRFGAETIAIVYSVKGVYTKRMRDFLAPGKTVWLKFPYGDFVIESGVYSNDLVLVAGGSGVSPFIPFLENLVENPDISNRVKLFYGIRDFQMCMFSSLYDRCEKATANFSYELWIENGQAVHNAKTGRLDIESIYHATKAFQDPLFFLSGPPVMIKNFKAGLLDLQVDRDHIKTDEWE